MWSHDWFSQAGQGFWRASWRMCCSRVTLRPLKASQLLWWMGRSDVPQFGCNLVPEVTYHPWLHRRAVSATTGVLVRLVPTTGRPGRASANRRRLSGFTSRRHVPVEPHGEKWNPPFSGHRGASAGSGVPQVAGRVDCMSAREDARKECKLSISSLPYFRPADGPVFAAPAGTVVVDHPAARNPSTATGQVAARVALLGSPSTSLMR